jgi:hypothetical protein
VPGQTGTGTQEKFVSQKVWVCPSCDSVNPATSTKCSGCGDKKETPLTDTEAATCPNCNEDRPFIAAHGGGVIKQNDDGTLVKEKSIGETYAGDCPHCQQTSVEANEALAKLKKGDSGQWGKGAARH